jgi:hypothetical protein
VKDMGEKGGALPQDAPDPAAPEAAPVKTAMNLFGGRIIR